MSNTLRIAELSAGHNGGLIGVTFAPGKKQTGAWSGTHDRDLAVDLDVVAAWNAAAVVTLTTAEELGELKIPKIGQEVGARFMEWLHLPIRHYQAPDAAFDAVWPEASRRLQSLVEAGARILVHCKGGLGRAGTIAARMLVELGMEADEAIALVRERRDPKAIETSDQKRWVRDGRAQSITPVFDPASVRDRAIGALLGLAVGDAVGTTIEFSAKPERVILHDMVGGGPFRLQPGQWTDDTSMALALADSLIVEPSLDARDLMERFVRWQRDGDYSCTGECFDIGITVKGSLARFGRTGDPFAGSTDTHSAGNGSIMRLAPVAIRRWRDAEKRRLVAQDQSRTTHGAAEAIEACATLSDLIALSIEGTTLSDLVMSGAARAVKGFAIGQVRADIEGSGYVVESLHAALWAVARTSTFRDAILLAANLGRDADTTAAIAGQIAGALYGASSIPGEWLEKLAWRARIEGAAATLFERAWQGPARSNDPTPDRFTDRMGRAMDGKGDLFIQLDSRVREAALASAAPAASELVEVWRREVPIPTMIRYVLGQSERLSASDLLGACIRIDDEEEGHAWLFAHLAMSDGLVTMACLALDSRGFLFHPHRWRGDQDSAAADALASVARLGHPAMAELVARALGEARRYSASAAVAMIHSFDPLDEGLSTFCSASEMPGFSDADATKLSGPVRIGGIDLYLGWCTDRPASEGFGGRSQDRCRLLR